MNITSDQQLQMWVDGSPQHKGDKEDPHSQCCPDFSCCRPDFLQPREVREAFAAARAADDEDQQMRMLGQFLGAAIATEFDGRPKVYIAGIPDTREDEED